MAVDEGNYLLYGTVSYGFEARRSRAMEPNGAFRFHKDYREHTREAVGRYHSKRAADKVLTVQVCMVKT